MATNYFATLAEQRRIKRNREEAFKRIKNLTPKEYQNVKKTLERLLKEAREMRRRLVKEGSSLHGSMGRSKPVRTVSDESTPERAHDEPDNNSGKTDEKPRRRKLPKKFSNTMPDSLDRKAVRMEALAAEGDIRQKKGDHDVCSENHAEATVEREEREEKELNMDDQGNIKEHTDNAEVQVQSPVP